MKTITKEINLLDIEDIEEAIGAYLDRKVSISDVKCTLAFCIPCDTDIPDGMYLDFEIDGEGIDSFDLFWDDEKEGNYLKGKQLALDEPYLPMEEIFNFDVSAFQSFNSWVDSSD